MGTETTLRRQAKRRRSFPKSGICRRPNSRVRQLFLPASSHLEPRTSNLQFLIGPPVIRIRSKSFRISGDSKSNRHKTRATDFSLATSHSTLTTAFLIGPPVIRIQPKPFRISTVSSSNRHLSPLALCARAWVRSNPSNRQPPTSHLQIPTQPFLATNHLPLATINSNRNNSPQKSPQPTENTATYFSNRNKKRHFPISALSVPTNHDSRLPLTAL